MFLGFLGFNIRTVALGTLDTRIQSRSMHSGLHEDLLMLCYVERYKNNSNSN